MVDYSVLRTSADKGLLVIGLQRHDRYILKRQSNVQQ